MTTKRKNCKEAFAINWELKLIDVSKSLYELTLQLENYRLQQLRYTGKAPQQQFELSPDDKKKSVAFLKSNQLLNNLIQKLNVTGVLGEDENVVILFLSLASYKYDNPFSVLCLAKSGIGKRVLLI